MIALLVLFAIIILAIAYAAYSSHLAKRLGLDATPVTLAYLVNDGVDCVPAKASKRPAPCATAPK
jgi:carbon starvation protein CstA